MSGIAKGNKRGKFRYLQRKERNRGFTVAIEPIPPESRRTQTARVQENDGRWVGEVYVSHCLLEGQVLADNARVAWVIPHMSSGLRINKNYGNCFSTCLSRQTGADPGISVQRCHCTRSHIRIARNVKSLNYTAGVQEALEAYFVLSWYLSLFFWSILI